MTALLGLLVILPALPLWWYLRRHDAHVRAAVTEHHEHERSHPVPYREDQRFRAIAQRVTQKRGYANDL